MTSATDKLRRLLDERGVEYQVRNDFVTYVFLDDRAITFFTNVVDDKMESVSVSVDFPKPVLNGTVWLTPEQAIAATLGRGTLTAEDVRSFLNRNSVFDDTTWPHGRQELVFDEDDLQAMADELNATLGRGAERDARCLGCKYQLDGMCMLPVGDDYRREFVDDDYFCASWEENA